MNKIAMTAIAASLAFAAPVFADDAHHPEKAAEAKGAPAQQAPQIRKMQDNVKKMQVQLERITKAKSDEERHKAMAEHMQTMQENMAMARGMKDCPMMGSGGMGMMGGGMGGGMGMMGGGMMHGAANPAGAPDRMQQMEKRMEMMQMMMQMMMQRHDAAPPMPAPQPTK